MNFFVNSRVISLEGQKYLTMSHELCKQQIYFSRLWEGKLSTAQGHLNICNIIHMPYNVINLNMSLLYLVRQYVCGIMGPPVVTLIGLN